MSGGGIVVATPLGGVALLFRSLSLLGRDDVPLEAGEPRPLAVEVGMAAFI